MEMRTNELRIGNLVINGKKIIEVKSIDEYGINHEVNIYDEGDGYYESEIVPTQNERMISGILITKEWLEKFGFRRDPDKVADQSLWFKDHVGWFREFRLEHKYWVEINEDWLNILSTSIIEYVHQLQNLYFALTGEELEIKEKVG